VINHLRQAAGLEGDEAPELKLAKIELLLSMEDRGDGTRLMAALLSLPLANGDNRATMSPARQRARTMQLLNRQMCRLAAEKPVLLVVEDAHWLDPTTEEMLGDLLDRLSEHRIMMIGNDAAGLCVGLGRPSASNDADAWAVESSARETNDLGGEWQQDFAIGAGGSYPA
jgi:hypothetical protein